MGPVLVWVCARVRVGARVRVCARVRACVYSVYVGVLVNVEVVGFVRENCNRPMQSLF